MDYKLILQLYGIQIFICPVKSNINQNFISYKVLSLVQEKVMILYASFKSHGVVSTRNQNI